MTNRTDKEALIALADKLDKCVEVAGQPEIVSGYDKIYREQPLAVLALAEGLSEIAAALRTQATTRGDKEDE